MYDKDMLDMKANNATEEIHVQKSGLLLYQGRIYLGRTMEYAETLFYVTMLDGRSSVGRLVISVNVTGGFVDVGFYGYWTLEITCIQPVWIYPYVEICQISYYTIDVRYDRYKSKKYKNNTDIQASMMYSEFEGSN